MSYAGWQHASPVRKPLLSAPFVFFSVLAVIGLILSAKRFVGGLAFTGMNDDYAIGVWKTFNVMVLTALGSSALAVGLLTWVFNQKQYHVIMRASLSSSLLFYGTGMFALGFDVGRPWNFYNVMLPWRWNIHSALLEISVCMTAYVSIFLLYENLPQILPERWVRRIKPAYPYMVAMAFLLPIMHQSSLGSLMVLAGAKVHPLWQTQMLPAFYLMQAIICGFAAMIILLMATCLAWGRPLDVPILAGLARWMAWGSIAFVIARILDVAVRGQLLLALEPTWYAFLFHAENLFVLGPALVLFSERLRLSPRILFVSAVITAIGGLTYRFSPTTFAFRYGKASIYFPSLGELLMCLGYVGLAVALFIAAARRFAILPEPLTTEDYDHDR
ncbi:MAG TPA: Ni/Fe-hydrogenase cytochrome b subunit [Thermoanaerobaculia bacterium]|jgi:Ni/Fe-hydrogenase subunit HybB-like protein|nr:Ni/Fe-hydrogenase cytochrome b subunit [Thermoanaerobaculia bacterium]